MNKIRMLPMKLNKITLPGLVLMVGLALGACQNPTNQMEPNNGEGNQDNLSVLGCGNPTACNEKTRQSLNRVIGEGLTVEGAQREHTYVTTIKIARSERRDAAMHSQGSTDNWMRYTTNCGTLPDACFNDSDRAKAEKAAREAVIDF